MDALFRERVAALRRLLRKEAAGAAYFSGTLPLRHLTGRIGMDDALLVLPNALVWLLDPRSLAFQDTDIRLLPIRSASYTKDVQVVLKNVSILAVEAETTTLAQAECLKKMLKGTGVRLKPLSGLLRSSRSQKSADELKSLAKAARIADAALTAVQKQTRLGMSEADVAWLLEKEMREHGAERLAFDTIVAFSEHAAVPHHVPLAKRKLRRDDLVLIDMGAVVDGMHSDMTRTFLPARASTEIQRVYDAVLRAQRAGVKVVRAGMRCADVDAACCAVLCTEKLEERFTHATGHGVGLEIHEFPSVSSLSEAVLQERMAVTVEPGAYVEGEFGVRIEDTLVVTEKGSQVLTKFSKRPLSFLLK